MNDTMYHRGPNDSGAEIYDAAGGYAVGFAQRRLSIMDLSPLGHQPMHAADKRVSVVFNGEIYNFQELKKELSDYPFCSQCDTEVILAAYEKWGIDCVSRFNGMFAIALYDRDAQEVYLVRDRIGKKPLYYWEDGENLVFASELKPILACPGFDRKLNPDILPVFLYQQYIPEPDTIFEQVKKLCPGTILRFRLQPDNGQKRRECFSYWSIKERYQKGIADPVTDFSQAKAELKAILQKSVKSRMEADVPLGTFLSGGYDSSLMTAMAQEASEAPVKTFSIGFEEKQYDESGYASAVAKHLGTQHTEEIIREKQMLELVESIPQYFDEPMADSSEIPTMLVSALARKQVTVALSGDGGDEFFCGYQMYQKLGQAQKLDAAGALVYGISQLPGLKQADLLGRLPFSVRTIAQNRDKRYKTQLCSDKYLSCIKNLTGTDQVRFDRELDYNVKNWQIRRMLLDMDTYLPGDILCKVDRASMKYSLEARCPILDQRVMEYSFRKKKTEDTTGQNDADSNEKSGDAHLLEQIAKIKKGMTLPVKSYAIKEGETSPPKRYNSGSMILAMENAGQLIEDEELRAQIKGSGIGTSATRAEILKKLVNNKYLSLNKKTQIITPTLQGELIYDTVSASIKSLLNPELTASWEKGLNYVAEGTITPEEYMTKLTHFIQSRTSGVLGLRNQYIIKDSFERVAPFYKKSR